MPLFTLRISFTFRTLFHSYPYIVSFTFFALTWFRFFLCWNKSCMGLILLKLYRAMPQNWVISKNKKNNCTICVVGFDYSEQKPGYQKNSWICVSYFRRTSWWNFDRSIENPNLQKCPLGFQLRECFRASAIFFLLRRWVKLLNISNIIWSSIGTILLANNLKILICILVLPEKKLNSL